MSPDGVTAFADRMSEEVSASRTLFLLLAAVVAGCGGESVRPEFAGNPGSDAGPLAFITHTRGGSRVTVIDASTHSVVTGVPNAEEREPRGVGASPDGRFVAWVNWETNDLELYDVRADSVLARLPVGVTRGRNVAFTPNGRFAYVASDRSDQVTVIRTDPPSVAKTLSVGDRPAGVVVSPDGEHLYVPNTASGDVSVIETATNSVVETIPVGSAPAAVPASEPAITPDGRFLYVANWASGDVSVIETATDSVVATIPVEEGPGALELTADGRRLFVLNSEGRSLSVVDVATNEVVETYPLDMADPQHLEVRPDGEYAYVGERLEARDNLKVVDPGTGAVQTLTAGNNIDDLEITPDGRFLYVTGTDSDDVTIVETATNTVVRTIPTEVNPTFIAFAPLEGPADHAANDSSETDSSDRSFSATTASRGAPDTLAFGAMADVGAVAVIAPVDSPSVDTIPVGPAPRKLAVSPEGGFVYVARRGGKLMVIDAASRKVVDSLRVAEFPSDLTVHPGSSRLYVSDALGDEVTAVDPATNTVAETIPVGEQPVDLEVTPDGARLYAVNHLAGTVSVIGTAVHRTRLEIPVGDRPVAAAVSGDGRHLYVASAGSRDLAVIEVGTDSLAARIPLVGRPTGALEAGRRGDFLYVGVREGAQSGHLAVINVSAMEVVARRPVEGGPPEAVVSTPNGEFLYAGARSSRALSIWKTSEPDTGVGSVAEILPGSPRALAVSPGGNFVLTSDRLAGGVRVIDAASRSYVSSVEAGVVWDLAFMPPPSRPPMRKVARPMSYRPPKGSSSQDSTGRTGSRRRF